VVQGTSFDWEMSRHYWNIIKLGDEYYHVDIPGFSTRGREASFLLSDVQMWNYQLWDIEKYPLCRGSLNYSDLYAAAGEDDPDDSEEMPDPLVSEEPSPSLPVSTPPVTPSQTLEVPTHGEENGSEEPEPPTPDEEI